MNGAGPEVFSESEESESEVGGSEVGESNADDSEQSDFDFPTHGVTAMVFKGRTQTGTLVGHTGDTLGRVALYQGPLQNTR